MCGVIEYVSIEPCHHRDEAPQTRHGMCAEGLKLAANVRVGQIVAGECANETEPYILFKCLGEMYTVTPDDYETNKGVYKHNWMGEVRPDDAVIKGLKLSRNRDGSFTETKCEFWLFAEDTRGVLKHKVVSRRQSNRTPQAPSSLIYTVCGDAIAAVERIVYIPNSAYVPKRKPVPIEDAAVDDEPMQPLRNSENP